MISSNLRMQGPPFWQTSLLLFVFVTVKGEVVISKFKGSEFGSTPGWAFQNVPGAVSRYCRGDPVFAGLEK